MPKIIFGALTITALILGSSSIASASPATGLLGPAAAAQTSPVERAQYYWNHHRYKHRSWDKRRRRWRYY